MLNIYGDYFDSETRTILIVLNICKAKPAFKLIETVAEELAVEEHFPMVMHGSYKIS